jgi:hypothetical protein
VVPPVPIKQVGLPAQPHGKRQSGRSLERILEEEIGLIGVRVLVNPAEHHLQFRITAQYKVSEGVSRARAAVTESRLLDGMLNIAQGKEILGAPVTELVGSVKTTPEAPEKSPVRSAPVGTTDSFATDWGCSFSAWNEPKKKI